MDITVYSKPNCMQCTATTRALEKQGLEYRIVDVTQDDDALATVQSLGHRRLPVVTAEDLHWSGFQPDQIRQLAS